MTISKWLPQITAIWFFVTINSFFTWNNYAPIFHIIPTSIVVIFSLFGVNYKSSYKGAYTIVFALGLFLIWILLRGHLSLNGKIAKILDFVPLLVMIFWPRKYIYDTYLVIRRVFIFYSIGCFIILLLSIMGVLQYIPYYVLPPQETIQKIAGIHYNVYGIFAVLNKSQTIVRNCGMTLEPGHFSIFLGFIYMIDKMMGQKGSFYLVLGAISAFSSTFFIIMILSVFYSVILSETLTNILKYLRYLIFLSLVAFVVYKLLPADLLESIQYLFYGRNLENVVDAFDENSSLLSALDVRASEESISEFNRLNNYQLLWGGSSLTELLSDYRGLILQYGIIGLFFSIFILFCMIRYRDLKMKLMISSAFLLVLLHRSWMLTTPYIYTLIFFAIILSSDNIMLKKQKSVDFSPNSIKQ